MELPSKFLEQIAFNTRPKIEGHVNTYGQKYSRRASPSTNTN